MTLWNAKPGSRRPTKIRIVNVPPGEAPLDVRRGWVGLEIPLLPGEHGARRMLVQGVVSGPQRRIGPVHFLWCLLTGRVFYEQGYRVGAQAAMAALEKHDAHAEAWWRSNAPHLLGPGGVFIFHASVCQLLEE